MTTIPNHYIPNSLSNKDKKIQKKELIKSRKMYKNKKYYTRKLLKSYKNKKSVWENRFKRIYNINKNQKLNLKLLSKKSKCSRDALLKIINKGMGAYYSSGSRPNQTPQSWGYARLYSSLSGGPASKVDFNILKNGCSKKSKSLKLALKPKYNTKRSKIKLIIHK